VTFRYDSLGRRIQKIFTQGTIATTTNYAYDSDNIIETTDATGNVLGRNTQGQNVDEPLALQSGTAVYYQADGLGSVTSLTDISGASVTSYDYDSFGGIVASNGTLANASRYTARQYDSETHLYYYRARYYDATVGRFLSEDPIEFLAGVNFYTYYSEHLIDDIFQVAAYWTWRSRK
jgi:RHS repeat-associated protein